MATTVTARVRDAGRRADIEDDLTNKFHVKWTYVHAVGVSQFDTEASLANQARFKPLDHDQVSIYRQAIERGDRMPAVIAYRPGRGKDPKLVIADGNHRLTAAETAAPEAEDELLRQLPHHTLDVYELDRATKPALIMQIMYYFNGKHGMASTLEERIKHAIFLWQNGAGSVKAAADLANAPLGKVQGEASKISFNKRAIEAGVEPGEWDKLNTSVKTHLNKVKTDEGMRAAAHLAYVAPLTSEEVKDLVSDLAGSRSAKTHREIVDAKELEYSDRIQDSGAGLVRTGADKKGMSPKAIIGQTLAIAARIPDDFMGLAQLFGLASERDDYAERLDRQSERFAKLAAAIRSQ